MKKKVLIIYNPCSGMKGLRKRPIDFYNAFPEEKFRVDLIRTKGKLDAKDIAMSKKDKYDVVLCAGGDGTFNEVINGVFDSPETVLAYYPNGTTNDCAKTLGLSRNIKKTVDLINSKITHKVDIGRMNDRYFICTVSFGFGSNASLKTKQSLKNSIGQLAYILTGVENINDIKPVKMKIKCDDEEISGKFVFGAIVNTISVGGVFKLDESSFKLNDGKFEVLLVRKLSSIVEIPEIISMLRVSDYDDKHIILRHCSNIEIEADRDIPWLIDGEFGGNCRHVEIKNCKKAINICSPESKYFK